MNAIKSYQCLSFMVSLDSMRCSGSASPSKGKEVFQLLDERHGVEFTPLSFVHKLQHPHDIVADADADVFKSGDNFGVAVQEGRLTKLEVRALAHTRICRGTCGRIALPAERVHPSRR